MSATAWRILFVSLVGTAMAVFAHRLGRTGKLSFRYSVGWLVLSGFGVFSWVFIPAVTPIARLLNTSPAAVLAIGALIIFAVICIQLSISISGLQEQNRRLAEELAVVRERAADRGETD
jgi:hypothetical protein